MGCRQNLAIVIYQSDVFFYSAFPYNITAQKLKLKSYTTRGFIILNKYIYIFEPREASLSLSKACLERLFLSFYHFYLEQ